LSRLTKNQQKNGDLSDATSASKPIQKNNESDGVAFIGDAQCHMDVFPYRIIDTLYPMFVNTLCGFSDD
jgi:hypothetical protein